MAKSTFLVHVNITIDTEDFKLTETVIDELKKSMNEVLDFYYPEFTCEIPNWEEIE